MHESVNHSKNFVSPDNPLVHIQNIERTWRDFKSLVPKYGRREDHFLGYLARAYLIVSEKNEKLRLHKFLFAVATLYLYNPGN